MKIKLNDTVKVVLGKDKGRTAKVTKVFPKENKILVEGVNLYKRHIKGNQGVKSGIYDLPRPLAVSKVMLVCPSCKKETRVGYKLEKETKLRVCRKCNKTIWVT